MTVVIIVVVKPTLLSITDIGDGLKNSNMRVWWLLCLHKPITIISCRQEYRLFFLAFHILRFHATPMKPIYHSSHAYLLPHLMNRPSP